MHGKQFRGSIREGDSPSRICHTSVNLFLYMSTKLDITPPSEEVAPIESRSIKPHAIIMLSKQTARDMWKEPPDTSEGESISLKSSMGIQGHKFMFGDRLDDPKKYV